MKKVIQKSFSFVKGIGLLELMLVLAIIGVMLTVSVRYYSNANTSQEASSLVNSYNTIKSAVENYLADNPTASIFPSMSTLVNGGYLPSVYGAAGTNGKVATVSNNYWGGSISISALSGTFSVVQTNIPLVVCNMAQGQLMASINQNLGESVVVSNAASNSGGSSSGTTSSSSSSSGGASSTGCFASSKITVTYVQ